MAESGSSVGPRSEPTARRMALSRAAPDLGGALPPDRQFVLDQISVPVVGVGSSQTPLAELLERYGAYAAVVVTGMVLHDLAIGAEPGMRILGPGDVIAIARERAAVLARSRYRAMPSTELALLGNDFLKAAQREPRLLAGLQTASAEQTERLAAQLVICQMPRVADRVLTMLWLLAESYGRVTPAGTRLPLSLTHELLGAMVGARRPTVTLALGELAKRGAVVHQDGSWLLLEPAPGMDVESVASPEGPELVGVEHSGWASELETTNREPAVISTLGETIRQLHAQHEENVVLVRERLLRVARSRQRSSEVVARSRATRELLRTKSPPSS